MLYFISDTHLGHENIIMQCSRPFSSVEEMDEKIISNWNRKVKKSDTGVILGDLIHKSEKSPEWHFHCLNSKKILIKGNHDEAMLQKIDCPQYFAEVLDSKVIEIQGHSVTLCHYPMREWKNSRNFAAASLDT